MRKKLISELKRLYVQKLTYGEISKELGMSRGWINTNITRLAKKGLRLHRNPARIKLIGKNKARCKVSNQVFPITCFSLEKRKNGTCQRAFCNKCRYKQNNENIKRRFDTWLKHAYNLLHNHAKQKNVLFNITLIELKNLYEKQKGLCYYTGFSMLTIAGNGHNKYAFSVDRINPGKGYTKNNIVLCTRFANRVKANLSMKEYRKWVTALYSKLS